MERRQGQEKIGPCFVCGKDGHLKKGCPSAKHQGKPSGGYVDAVEDANQPEADSEIFGVLTTSLTSSAGSVAPAAEESQRSVSCVWIRGSCAKQF